MVRKKCTVEEQNKKVVRLIHFVELNTCIKDEAAITGKTEAAIIEDAINKKYLNTDEIMADAVLYNITKEDAVTAMCSSVFSYFAAMPSSATSESIRPLLNYCIQMAVQTPLEIKKNDYLFLFQQQLELIYDFFLNCFDQNIVCVKSKEYTKVTKDIIDFFEMIKKDIDFISKGEKETIIWNCGEIATILNTLNNYLDFDNQDGITICNWSLTYRLLLAIAELSNWQNNSKNRYKIVKLIKEIQFADKNSNYLK